LGLLALALGTLLGFGRLFIGTSYLGALALPVIGSWVVGLILRRAGLRVAIAAPLGVAIGIFVVLWRFAPSEAFAHLPTLNAINGAGEAIRTSFLRFDRLIAPVKPTTGFYLVISGVLWVLGQFADTAALRFRAPVQAVVPYAATFLGVTLLSRETGRVGASLWFVIGLGIYTIGQRALAASEVRWFADNRRGGISSVATTALAIALVGLVGAAVVGPLVNSRTEGVIDIQRFGDSSASRTVVSPFVGIRNLLGNQGDVVMFTVAADQPAYWRLTALDEFDAQKDLWVSDGSYQRSGSELDSTPPASSPTLSQDITISGLGGPWLPAAFEPIRLTNGPRISFDPETSSILIRGADGASSGDSYQVESARVAPSSEAIGNRPAGPPAGSETDFLALPENQRQRLTELASSITAGPVTDLQKALAFQNYFRDQFTYDATADYRNTSDPFGAFITRRRGFCQQFSSAFALLARAAGLPARVAIGFTPGDAATLTTTTDDAKRTSKGFVVRGRHAHAWPEIHFAGIGWVPFEPTPDRGNPQAVAYTGIPVQQAPLPPSETTTTVPAPTTVAPGNPAVPPTTLVPGGTTTPSDSQPSTSWTRWWPLLAALAGIGLISVVAARILSCRSRRIRMRSPAEGPIAVAWDDAVWDLAQIGIAPHPAETPREFARRAGKRVDRQLAELDDSDGEMLAERQSGAALRTLAGVETARRYGNRSPVASEEDDAQAAATKVAESVKIIRRRKP